MRNLECTLIPIKRTVRYALLLFTLTSCSLNSPSEEQQLGQELKIAMASHQLLSALRAQCPEATPPFIGQHIERISVRLLLNGERPIEASSQQPVRVILLNCREPFSVTLPPKIIALSTGMIRSMPSEAALAFLLAHEFSHLMLGHLKPTTTENNHSYQKNQEEEADEAALLMVLSAHYHPYAALEALNNTASRSALDHPTHPNATARWTKLHQALTRTGWSGAGTVSSRGFLKIQKSLQNGE